MELWNLILAQFEQNCTRWITENPDAMKTIQNIQNTLRSFVTDVTSEKQIVEVSKKVVLPVKIDGEKITSHSQFWIYSQSFPFPVQPLQEPNTFLLYSDFFLLRCAHPERMVVNTWAWMESTMWHLYGQPLSDSTNYDVILLYYKDDFVAEPICDCH